MNGISTMRNELAQRRFNRRMNAIGMSALAIALFAVFTGLIGNL